MWHPHNAVTQFIGAKQTSKQALVLLRKQAFATIAEGNMEIAPDNNFFDKNFPDIFRC